MLTIIWPDHAWANQMNFCSWFFEKTRNANVAFLPFLARFGGSRSWFSVETRNAHCGAFVITVNSSDSVVAHGWIDETRSLNVVHDALCCSR